MSTRELQLRRVFNFCYQIYKEQNTTAVPYENASMRNIIGFNKP